MTQAQENLILALIGSEAEGLMPIEVHKMLFMLGKMEPTAAVYEFIPYKMGCYSQTLAHDLRGLESKGYVVRITDRIGKSLWRLTREGEARISMARFARRRIADFRQLYPLRGKRLIIDVYKRYPYWAINSIIADSLLKDDSEAAKRIAQARSTRHLSLVCIGYEGRSIENYFNALIKSGIGVLCDVRKNPISRKYGFSRSTLFELCEGCGIEYRHHPELGIPSLERQNLNCQKDYNELFAKYEKTILPSAHSVVEEIVSWVQQGRGVALTCFEANPAQCHRTRVANVVAGRAGVQFAHI